MFAKEQISNTHKLHSLPIAGSTSRSTASTVPDCGSRGAVLSDDSFKYCLLVVGSTVVAYY